ncbi:hypothetical protein GGR55DRAFT_550284 [Xylaria sp. FL0064]|nr:hypothetical protein GGR55DRAFT_550284 [Xylaria sp. FL0064]
MAPELTRPPTRTGSNGSRPPTSRFQEGSMNDRISAAPPAQFLGPEQLKEYEHQFYTEPPTPREGRKQRPFSAAAVYQHAPSVDEPQQQQQQEPQHQRNGQGHRPVISHKKSTSFFGRVRDALFHRGAAGGAGGGQQHGQGQNQKQQEVRRKHSSLQEPLRDPLPPRPPRPDYSTGRTRSEINIAQMFPNPRGGTDRPSREDVMASYNQLVASGFFQSHAIQSTRHAAPSVLASSAPTSAPRGYQTPILPTEHQAAPRGPLRIPSFHKSRRSGSASRMPSSNPPNRNSREYSAATMAAPQVAPRSSLSSLFRPSIPDLHTKDSWLTLHGRKRTRGDDSGTSTPEPQPSSSTAATSSGGYFAQPLKRVAKKLREMPSTSSQLNSEAKNAQYTSAPTTQLQSSHYQVAVTGGAADGVVRLVPSVSYGGTVHPNERPIRLRSPSPENTLDNEHEWRSERPPINERASSKTTRPRKTFSYTLAEPSRGRSRTTLREREREREQEQERGRGREHDKYRIQRRGSSSTRPENRNRTSRTTTPQPQNPLGQWQRVSLEDTMIHRDSVDSWRETSVEQQRSASPAITTSTNDHAKATRGRTTATPSPLQTMADANARSASKPPERWHGTGKAYHLKDRGSRPDLAVRRSEDSAKVERGRYGKENSAAEGGDVDWRRVDADGDVDVLVYETRGRMSRESHYRGQTRQEEVEVEVEHQPQWRIGNAL